MTRKNDSHVCAVCGKTFAKRHLVPGAAVRDVIAQEIAADHPTWSSDAVICQGDLAVYRTKYVRSLIASESGEISELEHEVLESIKGHEVLSKNVDEELEQKWTRGEIWADRIATFGGSWVFLTCFALFMFAWVVFNSRALLGPPPDPYPFILLNLVLSCLAAVQAPIIMMSQNRLEAKDRLRAQHDYQINLKAELEIRHLHDKLDHLLTHQWERLAKIQEIQLDLLSELERKR